MDEREHAAHRTPEKRRPDAREAIPVIGATSAEQTVQETAAQQTPANLP